MLGGKKELPLLSCVDLEETSVEDGYSRLLENFKTGLLSTVPHPRRL